jgi:DNA polymerase-1
LALSSSVTFEYEVTDGELPDVLCMVVNVLNENLEHVRTIWQWRGEFGKRPPFNIGPDTLFVAYSAWAEMQCFMQLGWEFPTYIFDQHVAYLAASNVLLPYAPDVKRNKPKKDLHTACRDYDLTGWVGIDKAAISKAIGEGRWREYGKEKVLAYCDEDVRMETLLLREQLRGRDRRLPLANPQLVMEWSNYSAKAVALVQAKGLPIDVMLRDLIQENRQAVIGELLRRFDPSYGDDDPIYTPEGGWSDARFETWLARNGLHVWPRLPSGKFNLKGDAFKLMYHIPGIEELHALRDSIHFIVNANWPIGRDGRNRCSLFPLSTATGRNAHSKSLFNAHAGMRSLIVFPHDATGFYLDWRTQEVGIAAALSGDEALMRDYSSGDIYHSLALMCGLTDDPDPMHWKKHNVEMRERMKGMQLGINYGMGVPSLARGLDRHPLIASHIIETHKRTYPTFWAWRDNAVKMAMLERRIESEGGWQLHVTTSPNQRTLFNFPMQSNGAEMLRLATWDMCKAGIVPVMLIHDGILLEETDEEKLEHAKEIMRDAGRTVCHGFEIGVDVAQGPLRNGARYMDKRPVAQKMWATMMDVLQTVGALPRKMSA